MNLCEAQVFLRVWYNIGLGAKMAVIVVIGVVSLVTLFAYLGTAALAESTQRTLQERVILAQTAARHIDYLLASIENSLTDTAAQAEWSDPSQVNALLDHAHARLKFYGAHLFLLDQTGALVAARPAITYTISFDHFASVAAARDGQAFAVSRYERPLDSIGTATIAVAPVRDDSKRVIGALVLTIDLAQRDNSLFTHPIGLGETGYMDLVDLGGIILASTRAERVEQVSYHGTSLAWMIQNRQQMVSTCYDCHPNPSAPARRDEVLAFAPLERAAWGVTVHQSEDEVFAATRVLQWRIFALLIICIGGALALVYLTTRSVIAPTQDLTRATERIATGDLDTPIRARGRDEIGALAQSFEAMRARLKDSIAEISAWNRELDSRVHERTAECRAAKNELEELYGELQQKEHARSELLHRVFSAQEEERKRIARELHDETAQVLTGLAYALDHAAEQTTAPEIQAMLERMHTLAETALQEIQRIILDLRPTMLDHLGLMPALRWYAQTRLEVQNIKLTMREIGAPRRLSPPVEIALFRVVQEAINNLARHSFARHAHCVFEFDADRVVVRITDDGIGFDPGSITRAVNGKRGLGLIGMEERMSAIGGALHLRSTPGGGAGITLIAPVEDTEITTN